MIFDWGNPIKPNEDPWEEQTTTKVKISDKNMHSPRASFLTKNKKNKTKPKQTKKKTRLLKLYNDIRTT